MIQDDKVLEIANRLLAKSAKGEVKWARNDAGEFYVWFTDAIRLELTFETPSVGSDYVEISIFNHGAHIGGIRSEDGDEHFPLLIKLYSEANRVVTKWDVVLDEIEKRLEQPGEIGLNRSDPFGGDDLPF